VALQVGIDATSWTNRRGYGRFARNALTHLVELDTDARYVFFADAASARAATFPEGVEVRAVSLRRVPAEAAAAESQRPFADLLRLSRAVSRVRLDVMLFPSVYTWFPVLRVPTVVGIHDLIAEELPELTFPNRAARTRWRLKRATAVRTARRIFTVSETSRTVIAASLGIAWDRISVVPEAPDAVFGPRSGEEIDRALTPLSLGAGTPFFVYVGGISPHKRLDTLLDAYATVVSRVVPAPRLVLAGALEDEAYLSAAQLVRSRIAELGLGHRVVLPGHVPDETLACLYAGALAFVSPSAAEGFGLPAVEAAASDVPVVLSDIAAHHETLGDAALYFPVGDSEALAAQLLRLIGDGALRVRMGHDAQARAGGFTWDAAARSLRAVLREAARG
jgi:glycosyltransferase involved in cell wall biosynthesis